MKLGAIGGGQMASAIIQGVVRAGLCAAKDISIFDVNPAQLESFKKLGVFTTSGSAVEIVQRSEVIILCVKPHIVPIVLRDVFDFVKPESHLIVSVAAGVTLATLEEKLPFASRVVRVMPNTPALINQSCSGISGGSRATPQDIEAVCKVFNALGTTGVVAEPLLDAITGVSGSGPAYVFLFIEALADGGVRAGLPRDLALKFAAQTVKGAAQMVLETGQHPGQLKDSVASPGGTTIAAIHSLEQGNFRGTVMDAVYAAYQRAEELGKNKL